MKHLTDTIREAFEATQLKRECRRLPNGDYENSFVNSAWRYFQAGVGAANGMTKGQKPVAWLCIVNTADAGPTKFFTAHSDPRGFPVFAAPVAQQYEAGDMASAHNDGFRAGVASVAQQPHEIEVVCPVCNHKFYEWPNDQQPQAEHHKCCANCAEHGECRPNNIRGCGYDPDDACNKQPQAEAGLPHMSQLNRLIAYSAAAKLRELGYEWDEKAEAWAPQQAEAVQWREAIKNLADQYASECVEFAEAIKSGAGSMSPMAARAGDTRLALHNAIDCASPAPQQAEAVPSDVVRDAERYRWLRNESWAGYNTGKGTPSVYTVDGAGNRRMMLAEEAMDAAIDAAIKNNGGEK